MVSEQIQSPVRYPNDLIDEEWEIIEAIISELDPYTTGRPRTTDLREIMNAIFYINKTGCPWRYLPKDFPSYKLVNYYYNKWTDNGMLEKINTALRHRLREKKDITKIQRGQSLIAKVSRAPQSRISIQGSMEASSSRVESVISSLIQLVA